MSRPSRRLKLRVSNRRTTSTSSAAAAPGAAAPGSSGNCSRGPWPSPWMRVTVPPHRRTYRSRPPATTHHLRKGNIASPTGASPTRHLGEVAPLDPFAEVSGRAFVAHHHLGASRRCSSAGRPSARVAPVEHHRDTRPPPRPSELQYQAPFAPCAPPVSRARPTRRA